MPRVSVIVPLYNKARYIDRCLDAIFAQSLTDFELIVVNDGSTDGGEARVEARRDSRLQFVSQKNAGPGAARNHGVRLASSPLVAFLDGDDAWDPDYLKASAEQLESGSPDVASITWGMMVHPQQAASSLRWSAAGIPLGDFRAAPKTEPKIIISMLANMLPSSTVMRKAIFEELGGYYAKYRCLYSEDAWLYLKMLLRYTARFDSRPLSIRFEDASELAVNLRHVRPMEPFLIDPQGLVETCPPEMAPLLREVMTRRALKTASVYGYWGESAQARQLLKRFVSPGDWRLPYFTAAIVAATPLGAVAGKVARAAGHRKG
jgi:glycosyltransferase involved in cell wall biosynthesis